MRTYGKRSTTLREHCEDSTNGFIVTSFSFSSSSASYFSSFLSREKVWQTSAISLLPHEVNRHMRVHIRAAMSLK